MNTISITRRCALRAALPVALWLALGPLTAAHAQSAPKGSDYPNKPIRIIVPFAPGGGTDFTARLLAQKLGEGLGVPVTVDNRPGAGTNIGSVALMQSPPDGYTLMLSSAATFAINPNLSKTVPYDPLKDFATVGLFARLSLLLVTNPAFPPKTLAEFIAYGRARPADQAIQFGSPGQGSTHQLAMEMLAQREDFRVLHVPYKGAAPAMQDLVAGVLPAMFLDIATGASLIKSGKIHVVATASPQRDSSFPDVPTIAESGVPGFDASAWIGVVAPAGTPLAIRERLNQEMNKALDDPGVKQKLVDAGAEPLKSTPDQFATYMKSEFDTWAGVIRRANLSASQ